MNKFLPLVLALCLSFTSFSQKKNNYYKNQWDIVENYELNNLPKSALEIVDHIYSESKKTENRIQTIKALIYKSKFALTLEENAQLKIIQLFKTEIQASKFPAKNILESTLANLYWQYFQQNRWKIYNRTKTQSKVDTTDFRTWDLETLFLESSKHFNNSLKNALLLQLTDLNEFNTLLNLQKNSKQYRPTLYDFLAHNALHFYKSTENTITKPAYKFEINNSNYISDYKVFSNLLIESRDSTSLQLKALHIYQNLLSFHNKQNNAAAIIALDIERLEYVRKNATFKEKDSLFHKSLQFLKATFPTNKTVTLVDYKLAFFEHSLANKYNSKTNLKFQFNNLEALKICEQAIEKFPKSIGAQHCKSLVEKIKTPFISIKAEKNIPTNQHSKLFVTYKNIDTLNTWIYKTSKEEYNRYSKMYNDSIKVNFIESLTPIMSFSNKLITENDFQKHSTEIKIPPLENGHYLLLTSPSKKITQHSIFATTLTQVTNIAIVQKSTNSKIIYQVIDRNNGAPLKQAKVRFHNTKTNRNQRQINKHFTTNEIGEFSFVNKKYTSNISIDIKSKGEFATFGDFYIYETGRRATRKNQKDEITIKPFIFTDRSIYRPGQTVFFKAIILQKNGANSQLFTNEYIEVVLEDPNGDEVGTLDLKLNEFGSINGSFKIPKSGLTGAYSIYLDESFEHDSKFFDNENYDFTANELQISVEEYKRPKFEVNFSPITETFKVNDSVQISGIAKAFAGSFISNAKVTYNVIRKIEFPSWFYWRNPIINSQSQEITHGITTTNDKGEYEITFLAQPDLSVNKANKPIFTYEIEAEITDINGETRSNTALIKVGYHNLIANVSIKKQLKTTEKNHSISINTTNLNGEFVPTKGVLKIFKLKAPTNVLRERLWDVPDYKLYSEKEYQKLFPNEPYFEDQTNVHNWKKQDLVFEKNFNTSAHKEIVLKKIKQWESGKYLVEIETTDTTEKETAKQLFEVINPTNNKVSDNQLFSITTNKESYMPNEFVEILIGTASKKMFVTIAIEKNHKIINTQITELNNTIKTIRIPVEKEDIGGFAIHYSYSKFNQFKRGTLIIDVPEKRENIEIETLTFRDKLQPGQKETWSFKIKGAQKNKASAELLASMYDASLDQFKSHHWKFNPIEYKTYHSYNNWNTYKSYGVQNFRVNNLTNSYHRNYNLSFDKMNWFGFNFNNNQYSNRTYLNSIREKQKTRQDQRTKYDTIVSGIVTDATGPLPGVNVIIAGTSYGTQTDFDGFYSIKVNKNDELVFSYIGYNSYSQKIKNSTTVNITLEEDAQSLDEVVVVGYGSIEEEAIIEDVAFAKLKGNVSGVSRAATSITIRGANSIKSAKSPLYIVDGKIIKNIELITKEDISSFTLLKDTEATALYGARGINGVILITTKKGQANLDNELSQIKARKNFNETAFFFPDLKTDNNGAVTFSFTMPEALTRWKLQLLAHTTNLKTASKTLTTVTQKELMVLPNTPRFLREGDTFIFSSKISNLTEKNLNGNAQLVLTNAISGENINALLGNTHNSKSFHLDVKGNTNLTWKLHIPENIEAVQYKIVAKAGEFSDGEQNVLPVLSNRMLVTETMPMWVQSNQTKTFSLDKLKNNTSTTLKNHKLTLEITSNPAWYAVQSLPYLIEYPYECAEQTFSKFYANSLASYIANSNPKIHEVFKQWKSSDALLSNLEKNSELKSILLEETPWLRDAESETAQKKRIALLFDISKLKNEQKATIQKLKQLQFKNGGFPWFKGSRYPNRYITQHIATEYGHLNNLNVFEKQVSGADKLISKAISYLDSEIVNDYEKLIDESLKLKANAKTKEKGLKLEKEYLAKNHLNPIQLHYLYMRSFYPINKINDKTQKAIEYYIKQSEMYWLSFNLYSKGMIALIHFRNNNVTFSKKIVDSLQETSIENSELGMYWKDNNPSFYWHQAPIETQALMIEVFSEIKNDTKIVDALKVWLLKNKQTNNWKTTKATSKAIYALLLNGTDWLSLNESVEISVGNKPIAPKKIANNNVEAGTGYFKSSWYKNEISPEMAHVTITKKEEGIAWGALYWQYFEDLDKITPAKTPLKLSKKLFLKQHADTGKNLTEILPETKLTIGDLVTVRIALKVDRTMEYIHLKDMRASGFEPINVLSSYKWQDGMGYYESTRDASTNFFIESLPKGIYVFEYDLRVNNEGNFSNGITTIQSMYAPEFSSHSEGIRIKTITNN